jgi:hypothetical protein
MMRDRKHLFIIDKKEVTEKEILRQRYKWCFVNDNVIKLTLM